MKFRDRDITAKTQGKNNQKQMFEMDKKVESIPGEH